MFKRQVGSGKYSLPAYLEGDYGIQGPDGHPLPAPASVCFVRTLRWALLRGEVPNTTTLSNYGLLGPDPTSQPQNAQMPVQVNSKY